MVKFSILIPVYQVEEFLEECIDSIKMQTFDDYEVIMIDDGSKDNSGEICDKYAAGDNRVKVIHKKNEGLLLARRDAIKMAKGEYLVFVDSDDKMEKNELQEINEVLKKYDVDIVLFNAYLYCNGQKKVFFKDLFKETVYYGEDTKVFLSQMTKDFSINGMWLKAVRNTIVDKENDYSICKYVSNGEDLLQSAVLYERANSVYYLNKTLYNYRINDKSMTKNYSENYYKSFRCAFERLIESLKKKGLEDQIDNARILLVDRAFEDILQSCESKSPLSWKKKEQHLKTIANDNYLKVAYSKIKKINPFKRSQVCFFLLENKMYKATIIYINLWKLVRRKN